MKIEFQIVEIKKYGNADIIFKADKYEAIKKYLAENAAELVGKKIQIQQATIIKK